jgi:hypothetical protein
VAATLAPTSSIIHNELLAEQALMLKTNYWRQEAAMSVTYLMPT